MFVSNSDSQAIFCIPNQSWYLKIVLSFLDVDDDNEDDAIDAEDGYVDNSNSKICLIS